MTPLEKVAQLKRRIANIRVKHIVNNQTKLKRLGGPGATNLLKVFNNPRSPIMKKISYLSQMKPLDRMKFSRALQSIDKIRMKKNKRIIRGAQMISKTKSLINT